MGLGKGLGEELSDVTGDVIMTSYDDHSMPDILSSEGVVAMVTAGAGEPG